MTTAQETYRDRLIKQTVDAAASFPAGTRVLYAAFALSLPVPQTTAEASAQIDALTGGWQEYGRANRAWAEPIIAKVVAAYGKDGKLFPVANVRKGLDYAANMRRELTGVLGR